MTKNELRNGITTTEVVKSLEFEQARVIIKDINNNEIDRYWYRNDGFHEKRISDDYKVLTVSITTEVSIIRCARDPQVILTVNIK